MSSEVPSPGVDRRSFLKGLGTTVAAAAAGGVAVSARVSARAEDTTQPAPDGTAEVLGPGAVPVTLSINGESKQFSLEPRVTLLDALRNFGPLTGTKEVCDRGMCGACTVLVDGKPTYSCMKLAVEVQGAAIRTIEGEAKNGQLTAVQQAFVDCDALMCGFCTPGFVMTATALLEANPHPTEEEVRRGCAGNLCRCGAYPHIVRAVLRAGGAQLPDDNEVISDANMA